MSQVLRQKEEQSKDSKRSAPLFGVNINPYTSQIDNAFRIANLADELGLDTIGIQDHPYNGSFIDTWTFLTAPAVSTRRVHFFTNVADLPLRPAAAAADHVRVDSFQFDSCPVHISFIAHHVLSSPFSVGERADELVQTWTTIIITCHLSASLLDL